MDPDIFLSRVRDWQRHADAFAFLNHSEAAVLLLAAANLRPSHWAVVSAHTPDGVTCATGELTAAAAEGPHVSDPVGDESQLALVVLADCCWRERVLTGPQHACLLQHAAALCATGVLGEELAAPLPTSVSDEPHGGAGACSSTQVCEALDLPGVLAAAHAPSCVWRNLPAATAQLLSSVSPGSLLDSWVVRHRCAAVNFSLLPDQPKGAGSQDGSGASPAQPTLTRCLLPRGAPPSLIKPIVDEAYGVYRGAARVMDEARPVSAVTTVRGSRDGEEAGDVGAAGVVAQLTYTGSNTAPRILELLFPRPPPMKRSRADGSADALEEELAALDCRVPWYVCLLLTLLGLRITAVAMPHGDGHVEPDDAARPGEVALDEEAAVAGIGSTARGTSLAAEEEATRPDDGSNESMEEVRVEATFPLEADPAWLPVTPTMNHDTPEAGVEGGPPTKAPALGSLLSWELRCAYCGCVPEVRVEVSSEVRAETEDCPGECKSGSDGAAGTVASTMVASAEVRVDPLPSGARPHARTVTTTTFTYHVSLDPGRTTHGALCPWARLFLPAALQQGARGAGGSPALGRDTSFTFDVRPVSQVAIAPSEGVPASADATHSMDGGAHAGADSMEEPVAGHGGRASKGSVGETDEQQKAGDVVEAHPSDPCTAEELEGGGGVAGSADVPQSWGQEYLGVSVSVGQEMDDVVRAQTAGERDPSTTLTELDTPVSHPESLHETRFRLVLHIAMSTMERLVVCWRASQDAERRFPDAYLHHPLSSLMLGASMRPLPADAIPRPPTAATPADVAAFLHELRGRTGRGPNAALATDSVGETEVVVAPLLTDGLRETAVGGVLRVAEEALARLASPPAATDVSSRPMASASSGNSSNNPSSARATGAGVDVATLWAEGHPLWSSPTAASAGSTPATAEATRAALVSFLTKTDALLRCGHNPDGNSAPSSAQHAGPASSSTFPRVLPAPIVAELVHDLYASYLPSLAQRDVPGLAASAAPSAVSESMGEGAAVATHSDGDSARPAQVAAPAGSTAANDASLADAFLAELRRKAVMAEQSAAAAAAAAAAARIAQQAQQAKPAATQERRDRERPQPPSHHQQQQPQPHQQQRPQQQQQLPQQQRPPLQPPVPQRPPSAPLTASSHPSAPMPTPAVSWTPPRAPPQPSHAVAPTRLSAHAAPFTPSSGLLDAPAHSRVGGPPPAVTPALATQDSRGSPVLGAPTRRPAVGVLAAPAPPPSREAGLLGPGPAAGGSAVLGGGWGRQGGGGGGRRAGGSGMGPTSAPPQPPQQQQQKRGGGGGGGRGGRHGRNAPGPGPGFGGRR